MLTSHYVRIWCFPYFTKPIAIVRLSDRRVWDNYLLSVSGRIWNQLLTNKWHVWDSNPWSNYFSLPLDGSAWLMSHRYLPLGPHIHYYLMLFLLLYLISCFSIYVINFFAVLRFLQSNGYRPQPLDLTNIALSSQLELLVNQLAENTHNIWAMDRIKQGWSYGCVEASCVITCRLKYFMSEDNH